MWINKKLSQSIKQKENQGVKRAVHFIENKDVLDLFDDRNAFRKWILIWHLISIRIYNYIFWPIQSPKIEGDGNYLYIKLRRSTFRNDPIHLTVRQYLAITLSKIEIVLESS